MEKPVCAVCKRDVGVQFAVFVPRVQPFGSVCVACEASDAAVAAITSETIKVRGITSIDGKSV